MPSQSGLTDATDEEVLLSLSLALHHDGRKRFQHADDIKARLVTAHVLRHLKQSNYVIIGGRRGLGIRRQAASGEVRNIMGFGDPRARFRQDCVDWEANSHFDELQPADRG